MPCSFQTTEASSSPTLSPLSAVSPLPSCPHDLPNPTERGLLVPRAWLAGGMGSGGCGEAPLFSCLAPPQPAACFPHQLCCLQQASPSQLCKFFLAAWFNLAHQAEAGKLCCLGLLFKREKEREQELGAYICIGMGDPELGISLHICVSTYHCMSVTGLYVVQGVVCMKLYVSLCVLLWRYAWRMCVCCVYVCV